MQTPRVARARGHHKGLEQGHKLVGAQRAAGRRLCRLAQVHLQHPEDQRQLAAGARLGQRRDLLRQLREPLPPRRRAHPPLERGRRDVARLEAVRRDRHAAGVQQLVPGRHVPGRRLERRRVPLAPRHAQRAARRGGLRAGSSESGAHEVGTLKERIGRVREVRRLALPLLQQHGLLLLLPLRRHLQNAQALGQPRMEAAAAVGAAAAAGNNPRARSTRIVERGARLVPPRNVGTCAQQPGHAWRMPLPRRDDERCGAALLAWVECGVRIEKELHAVRMPVKARRVQRSHALAVAPVECSCRPWAVVGAGPSQPRRRPRGRKASRPLHKRHPKVLHSALVSRLPGAWHTLPPTNMLATLTSRGR